MTKVRRYVQDGDGITHWIPPIMDNAKFPETACSIGATDSVYLQTVSSAYLGDLCTVCNDAHSNKHRFSEWKEERLNTIEETYYGDS